MIRLLIFHTSILAAYLTIRSGGAMVGDTAQWWRISLGAGLLLVGVWASQVGKMKRATGSLSRQWRSCAMQFSMAVLLFVGIHMYFLEAPAMIDRATNQLVDLFASEEKKSSQKISQALRQQGPTKGNWLWNNATMRPLPRKTDLKPGNKPEVFLQFSDPAMAKDLVKKRAYVSAFALGTYDQASWMLTPAEKNQTQDFPQRIGIKYRYSISHSADESGQNPLVGLQGMIHAEIAPLHFLGDGIRLLPSRSEGEGYQYFATSQPMLIEDLSSLQQAAQGEGVPSEWLALPKEHELDVRIRGLCAEATQSKNTREKLLQIRDFLRKECRYSLKIQNEKNLDPLENFLFHEKIGHCEMFATAGAVAARALGIPSRVAFGWAGGSYFENSNLYVFRAREAHAWTEVLIDQVGWVIMDCTPESAIGRSRQAANDESPITKEDMEIAGPIPEDIALAPPYLKHTLIIVGCAALLCVGLMALTRKNPDQTEYRHSSKDGIVRNYVRAFYRYCGRVGLRILPSDTVKKLMHQLPDHPSWREKFIQYHYRVRYGKSARDPQAEEILRKACEEETR